MTTPLSALHISPVNSAKVAQDVAQEERLILPEESEMWAKDRRDRERGLGVTAPKKYKNTTAEDLRSWLLSWEQHFEAKPYSYNTEALRVHTAAFSLEKKVVTL